MVDITKYNRSAGFHDWCFCGFAGLVIDTLLGLYALANLLTAITLSFSI